MMEKAIKAIQTFEEKKPEPFVLLKEKVAEIVRKGLKTAFIWRHLRIEYRLMDEHRNYRTHFIVSNPWTGNQVKIYIKDYIGKSGAIKYVDIAHQIKIT